MKKLLFSTLLFLSPQWLLAQTTGWSFPCQEPSADSKNPAILLYGEEHAESETVYDSKMSKEARKATLKKQKLFRKQRSLLIKRLLEKNSYLGLEGVHFGRDDEAIASVYGLDTEQLMRTEPNLNWASRASGLENERSYSTGLFFIATFFYWSPNAKTMKPADLGKARLRFMDALIYLLNGSKTTSDAFESVSNTVKSDEEALVVKLFQSLQQKEPFFLSAYLKDGSTKKETYQTLSASKALPSFLRSWLHSMIADKALADETVRFLKMAPKPGAWKKTQERLFNKILVDNRNRDWIPNIGKMYCAALRDNLPLDLLIGGGHIKDLEKKLKAATGGLVPIQVRRTTRK